MSGNRREARKRIGEWLACGREFLTEKDSHFARLGPGANHAPVAASAREFAAEIERALQEGDQPLLESDGRKESTK